jgi:hypothetical protein
MGLKAIYAKPRLSQSTEGHKIYPIKKTRLAIIVNEDAVGILSLIVGVDDARNYQTIGYGPVRVGSTYGKVDYQVGCAGVRLP